VEVEEKPRRQRFTGRQLLFTLLGIAALNQSLQLVERFVWPDMPLWIPVAVLLPSLVAYCVIPLMLAPHLTGWLHEREERKRRSRR